MQSVSFLQGLSIEFITDMIIQICKTDDDDEEILSYLFDVFAKQQPYLKKQAITDFAEVFGLPKSTFGNYSKLSSESFFKAIEGKKVNFSVLRDAQPMITAMVALTPKNDKEEKLAILSALHGSKHLENYIYEHLPEEKEFFVLEKKFWDDWCHAINWEEDTEFGLKMERK